jgi:hypothetical protein
VDRISLAAVLGHEVGQNTEPVPTLKVAHNLAA